MLTEQQIGQAMYWYIKGYDLITIAQHFGVSRDQLARAIHKINPYIGW